VGSGTLEMMAFTYDDAWRNIINTGTVTVDVRLPQGLQEVWAIDSPVSLGASEVKTFIATASDPFMSAVAPASGTDYTLMSGSVTPTISRTSGASTVITLTAGGGGAVLDRLALRAKPVSTIYSIQATASDSGSITEYGPRSFPGDMPFSNVHDAQAVLDTAVQMHAEPLPVISGDFAVGQNATRAASVLARDFSQRVTVQVTGMDLDDDFFIEAFGHAWSIEADHVVTVGMEKVPPDGATTAADIFILGHRLGSGKLAL